jgi:hypothetical protein
LFEFFFFVNLISIVVQKVWESKWMVGEIDKWPSFDSLSFASFAQDQVAKPVCPAKSEPLAFLKHFSSRIYSGISSLFTGNHNTTPAVVGSKADQPSAGNGEMSTW